MTAAEENPVPTRLEIRTVQGDKSGPFGDPIGGRSSVAQGPFSAQGAKVKSRIKVIEIKLAAFFASKQ